MIAALALLAASCAPSYELTGEWAFSTLAGATPGKSSFWTTQVGAKAVWKPAFTGSVKARVALYKVVHTTGNDARVKVDVIHAGRTDTLTVDFTKGGSGWQDLGVFEFKGGCDESVVLTKAAAGANTRAAAVRFDSLNAAGNDTIASFTLDQPTRGPYGAERVSWKDVQESPDAAIIEWLSFRKIVDGVTATEFAPEAPVTRGDFAMWLQRAKGEKPAGRASAAQSVFGSREVAGTLTKEQILTVLFDAAKATPKNKSWLKTDVEKSGMLDGLGDDLSRCSHAVTRRLAAKLIAGFRETFIDAGPPANARWRLTFDDEFNGKALDTAEWSVESGSPGHILSSRWPENVLVADGRLQLLTKQQERGGKQWTTGNIWSRFRQQYGYFEARMRIGAASGLNNAFWLMTTFKRTDPMHFEIDITESHYPSRHTMTLHNWAGTHTASGKAWMAPVDLSEDFHIYALEWTETTLRFFFDGELVREMPNTFCHADSPLRLSSAVGAWAGAITGKLDGTRMEVDWVRVWQREK